MKKNIVLVVSYDGTDFLGWQKTRSGPTVEEALETALSRILSEKISLQAASRTDAGVHAEGQVVNFFTEKNPLSLEKLLLGVNALLPSSIAVRKIEEKPAGFHPTLDGTGKEYLYRICNTRFRNPLNRFFAWHIPKPLDLSSMRLGAEFLLGTHDFTSFCNHLCKKEVNPICTVSSIVIEKADGKSLDIQITGDRFLYKMVRNLVGTLVYVGLGKIPPKRIEEILTSRCRPLAGVTAPARGLRLMQVFYKNRETGILSPKQQEDE